MRKERELTCLACNNKFLTRETRRKFCGRFCSAKYNGKFNKPLSEIQKQKISLKLKILWREDSCYKDGAEKIRQIGLKSQLNKHKNPKSILELSKRTVTKICKRLNLCCSHCGWDEDTCDLHHILKKKKGGTDAHSNLVYLCPNCHRLAGKGKILTKELITFEEYIGNRWLSVYFG